MKILAKKGKRSEKAGLPPGTPVHIGEPRDEKVKITLFDYDENHCSEKTLEHAEDCFPFKDKPSVTWINMDGIHDVKLIEKIGQHFGIHPLVLEDIVNTEQRPKMEDFGNYLFVVLKMLRFNEGIASEQVSMIIGNNYAISFQETEGDVFNNIRERIRTGKARIRKLGADYLAYSLIDSIVDNYFAILEKFGDRVEEIEESLVTNPSPEIMHTVQKLKADIAFLRKSVWPLREVINSMIRSESAIIQNSTDLYLKDVHDHTIQIVETIETFRDRLSEMMDIYLSSLSNKMNEVMKVLTIIATIFIPLTFIVGIYGMNFQYMPELEWPWGYPLVILAMLGISAVMLAYFRRKKWI